MDSLSLCFLRSEVKYLNGKNCELDYMINVKDIEKAKVSTSTVQPSGILSKHNSHVVEWNVQISN